jgi:signal transduction histidine kinase
MSQPDALIGPTSAKHGRRFTRADNPLVRAVGRVPVKVRTKMLVALATIVALLIAVGVLGLGVLGRSNTRAEALGTLQLRVATYQTLQTQAAQLRQLLSIRSAQFPNVNTYVGGKAGDVLRGSSWILVDQAILAALSQLGPAANTANLGFVPPKGDAARLDLIRLDDRRLGRTLTRMLAADRATAPSRKILPLMRSAIATDKDLFDLAAQLATTTSAETSALIAQNASSYTSSRNLFIGAGVAGVLLAGLVGLVLSWSVIGPVQRTEARLAEIAAGDFSSHLEVPNRDELGSLAKNLNRMNDELRRLYEELETVSRHKSEFLANMSHELRTPLNAIIGFSELLQLQPYGELNERQLGYVDDVLDAGRHLLSLINDILDLSKVEAGKMELDISDVSLRDALESGLTMHAERAARAGVAITLELAEDITVQADERKLRQVVFNLLSNAVKFTPAGGHVDVSAHEADGVVTVAVTDTGPGIAPEDETLIFDEFQQARGGSNGADGTGLGLPLARRFIELHGGRLWVETARGSGSSFRFTLPIDPVL